MPTVVLVDCSLSLARPIGSGDRSRKELVQRGVYHFFQTLEEKHPLEDTALLTFSSESQIIVPFTTDYTTLKNSLYSIWLQDKTCLSVGISKAISHVEETWGNDTACQVILIIDGRPNGGIPILEMEIPLHVKLHVISLGDPIESDLELFKALSKKSYGTFQFVELPHNAHLFRHCFDTLVNTQYSEYQGVLACGNLSSEVTLHPNPNISLFRTMASEKDLSPTFPSTLNIIGFIPNKKIPSPPTLSRHIILPSSNSKSFCLLLNECLKDERRSAIVQLGKEWFAIINSISEKDKTGLMLSMFSPQLHIPWIGKFSQLSTLAMTTPYLKIPLKTEHSKSYVSSKSYSMPSVKPDVLQSDFQKISRYAKNLPQKHQVLQAECERIQHLATMYYLPSLKTALLKLIQQELSLLESQASEGALMLRDILYRMSNDAAVIGVMHHDHALAYSQQQMPSVLSAPQESIPVMNPHSPRTSGPPKQATKAAMSVTNLLN